MNKLTYKNKFKDRTPEETIQIIENYFNDLGCILELSINENTVINTWCCHLVLSYDENIILTSNGKGVTEIYSKASAYAELYERFCNRIFYFCNTPLSNRVIELSKRQYGYYLHPEEKMINFEEAFLSSKIGRLFYEPLEQDNKVKNYFTTIYQNKFIGVPFHKSHSDEIKYLDPRIVNFLSGSTGMSAGNTFHEAYIQGMSEIYEHQVANSYYLDIHPVYYAINLKQIKNPKLQELITNIQKDNTLYIIDFSYTYGTPVICGIIVNKKTHTVSVDLGSAPIFDIACERVLTEFYQGREKGFDLIKGYGQFPSVDFDLRMKDIMWPRTETEMPAFPEQIFSRIRIVNNHSNIFLEGEYTNEELYNYLKTINDNNNFDIYWYNCSGIKEMYALKLFNLNAEGTSGIDYKNFSEFVTMEHIDACKKYYLIIEKFLQTSVVDIDELFSCNQVFLNTSKLQREHVQFLMFDVYLKWTNPSTVSSIQLAKLMNILLGDRQELCHMDTDILFSYIGHPAFYKALNKYALIIRYLAHEEYSINDIKTILNFLEIDYTNADIQNLNNHQYLVEQIIFADLRQYHEGKYDNLLKLYASYNQGVFNEK